MSDYKKVKINIDGKLTEVYEKLGYTLYSFTKDGLDVYSTGGGSDPVVSENADAVFKVNEVIAEPTCHPLSNKKYYNLNEIQNDLIVKEKLEIIKREEKKYDLKTNNCADLVTQGLEAMDVKFKDIGKEELKHPKFGFKAKVSTPNQLALKLKDLDVKAIKITDKIKFKTQEFINNYEKEHPKELDSN